MKCNDAPPILFDLGTGVRCIGEDNAHPLVATALVTHLHWDHVQGFPFCAGFLRQGSEARLYGPPQEEQSFSEHMLSFVRPPFFPVDMKDLPCELTVSEIDNATVDVFGVEVMARPVPHVGPTNGYRVSADGRSVAYVPDHQQPEDSSFVAESVLDLARGVDLLIHDAQYTQEELAQKSDWGHCTVDYAVEVARQAGVRCLALFHHDPAHDDDTVDAILERGQKLADGEFEVIAAYEGLSLTL